MTMQLRGIALPVLVGSLAGILASVGASAWWRSIDGRGQTAAPALVHPVPAAAPADADRNQRHLEARLAALEDQVSARGVTPERQAVATSPARINRPAPLSPDDYHQSLVYAHQASRRDPAWSRRTEGTFNAKLTELGTQRGFQLVDVDCRESSCTALVEWPTYTAAVSGYPDILHEDYDGMTCHREALLPEPPRPNDPYRATVVFSDCKAPPLPNIEPL
jgi:hypothetical protein